jgi:hypothetical protein
MVSTEILSLLAVAYACNRFDSHKHMGIVFEQDFKPRIYFSDSDFATITLDGKLCNSDGKLGLEQFETVFRRMLKLYTQRQVIIIIIHGILMLYYTRLRAATDTLSAGR